MGDSLNEQQEQPACAPLFALDAPARETVNAGPIQVRGWCFHPDLAIEGVVIHEGGRQAACAYGSDRPDVGAQFPRKPRARRCGFSGSILLQPGRRELRLEVIYANGSRWHSEPLREIEVRGWTWLRRILTLARLWTWRSRELKPALTPGPEIQPMPEGFESVGDDPFFLLEGKRPAGWTEIRYQTDNPGFVRVQLYFDTGQGFNEMQSTALFGDPRGAFRGFAWIPLETQALRFDVGSMPGRFTLEDLTFREIGKLQLFWRGLAPILRRLPSQPWRSLRRLAGVFARLALNGRQNVLESLFSTQTNSYSEWVALYDSLDDDDRQAIRDDIDKMRRKPTISVIMPVFNTPERYLREAIESVTSQLYPHWELCIADDASTKERVRAVLEECAERDPRITVVYREKGGHISAASNSALEMATGEYVTFLDHDDLIAEHALYRVAKELERYPEARLIYSDEDKIDAHGRRHSPFFKPSWSPDLLLSQNYVCHLAVYEIGLARKVGGLREGFEGSQDHDFVLRCSEFLSERNIRHIPQALYHWRELPGSTALNASAKPYAKIAGKRAIEEYLQRNGAAAEVDDRDYYHVRYALPERRPLVSLIIPTRNGLELTRACVDSVLRKTDYRRVEILIVDNQSDDAEALAWFREIEQRPEARVLRYDAPFNFSAINNYAAKHANGEILGLINNDIEAFEPDWLTEMTAHAMRPEVGAVGAKLFYPDGRVQHAGVALGVGGVAGHVFKRYRGDRQGYFGRLCLLHNVSAVTAACMLTRRALWEELGGMNEQDLTVAFNDVDFCLRLRERGYRIVMNPRARLVHHESVTRGSDFAPEKIERFKREIAYMHRRWGELLQHDPYYNPNLTLAREDYSLSWQPRSKPPMIVRPPLLSAPEAETRARVVWNAG